MYLVSMHNYFGSTSITNNAVTKLIGRFYVVTVYWVVLKNSDHFKIFFALGTGDANPTTTTTEAVVTVPSTSTAEQSTVTAEPSTTTTSSETVASPAESTATTSDSTTSPVTSESTSTSSPVVGSFASLPGQVPSVPQPALTGVAQPGVPGVAQPAVVAQPGMPSVAQPAQPGVAQQPLANDVPATTTKQSAPKPSGKKPDVYADVMKASKMLAQTGPGPIPIEAMNYFNRFGGAGNVSPQTTMGVGVQPQAMAQAAQAVPAVQPQQTPAVSQPLAPQPNNVQQYHPQQQQQQQQPQQQYGQQQQQQYAQQQAAYQYQQDQRQRNPYYYNMYKPPRPYVSRNGDYHPPAPRPYPMHKDELDKSTGM